MMEKISSPKMPQETLEHLLSGIPFFKVVKQQDPAQFDLLLKASRVITYIPGALVLQKGDLGNWLYFLLKGKLAVYVDRALQSDLVNYITPGEVFGDLAQLVGTPRTATVIADYGTKDSTVLALDFNVFGQLNSTTPISLQTKLAYYRNTAHNLRWKLEVYRSQHLQHPLANKHRHIKLFYGPKDTYEELLALHEQSKALAVLILEWNKEFGAIPVDGVKSPEQS
jgi:CRP/FNR family transcriptional regulator, cyclic AMP receptor protein